MSYLAGGGGAVPTVRQAVIHVLSAIFTSAGAIVRIAASMSPATRRRAFAAALAVAVLAENEHSELSASLVRFFSAVLAAG